MSTTYKADSIINDRFSSWRTRILFLMLFMAAIVFSISLYNSYLIRDIDKQWHAFEQGRNEKAQFISSIIREFGYGGMIHHFKDYVLRGEEQHHDATLEKIGAILMPIHRYHALAESRAEFDALTTIEETLAAYRKKLLMIKSGWEQGVPVKQIDQQIIIDDKSTLKAIQRLSKLSRKNFDDSDKIQRYLQAYEQLNTAMGYGGLIHALKNYVLRADKTYMASFLSQLAAARQALTNLAEYGPNQNNTVSRSEIEILTVEAITDIETVLSMYESAIKKAEEMHAAQITPDKIDAEIKFENRLALDALSILRRYLSESLDISSQQLNSELNSVRLFGSLAPVFLLFILLSLSGAMLWLARIDKSQRQSLEAEIDKKIEAEKKFKQLSEELENRVETRTEELSTQIKEREAAETALVESERRIKGILNSAADVIITADTHGIVRMFNQAAEDLFQQTSVDAMGKSLHEFLPFLNLDNLDWEIVLKRASFKSRRGERISSALNISGDEGIIVDISVSEIAQSENSEFTIIARDISEQTTAQKILEDTVEQLREAQDSLIESEKMAALGNLVAGIAHEINTPVGVSVTAASHLEENVQELKQMHDSGKMSRGIFQQFMNTASESSKIIQSNLQRASELVKSFKQVAVDQSSDELRSIDLEHYLNEIISSLQPQLKKTSHKIELSCDVNYQIETYPGSLSQIISNLIINSIIHAYDENNEGLITITAIEYDKQIEIIYNDNGKGIPADNINKIFDPFFTTKRGSGGSGLGLHIIYNLVTQKLAGTISCKSQEGEGTCFEIKFPARTAESLIPQRLAS